MEAFYLTLTSNGAGHYAGVNKQSQFRAHLGKSLKLQGDWEVGLAEIHLPCTLYTRKKTIIKGGGTVKQKPTVETDLDDPELNLLNIECDLIADQFIDHAHHRTLRTINVKKDKYVKDAIKSFSFGKIYYFPLSKHDIASIEVLITTDAGKNALFQSGTVTALLHFRPKRNGG